MWTDGTRKEIPMHNPKQQFCGRTRREFLWQAGGGFVGTGLAAMMAQDGFLASQAVAADGVSTWKNPLAPKEPHFTPKAKNVILVIALVLITFSMRAL